MVKVKFEDLRFFLLPVCPGWTLTWIFLKNTNIQKSVEVWKSGSLNGFKCSNLLSVNEVWKFKKSGSSRILEVQEVLQMTPKLIKKIRWKWNFLHHSVRIELLEVKKSTSWEFLKFYMMKKSRCQNIEIWRSQEVLLKLSSSTSVEGYRSQNVRPCVRVSVCPSVKNSRNPL